MDNTLDNIPTSVLNYPLTATEATILDAACDIKFGELLDVTIIESEQTVLKPLAPQQKAFIETLRDEGLSFLHTVVVHNGYPSQIEIDGKFGDIKYRRKIRFN